MKRYLLFSGFDYYPRGGWKDFKGSFDTKEEAQIADKENTRENEEIYMWKHIVDTESEEMI